MIQLLKMARNLLLLLPLVAVLTLSGCGGEEGDIDPPVLTLDDNVFRTPTQAAGIDLGGTVEAGSTVEVFLNDNKIDGSLILVNGGDWSATVNNLLVGANVIEIRATDDTGNNNSLALVIVREVVTIEQFVTPTPDGVQTVAGRAAPGNTVTVSITNTAGEEKSAGTANLVSGGWSYDVTGVLDPGDYTLKVTADDGAGGVTETSVALKVQAGAPLLVMGPFAVEVFTTLPTDTTAKTDFTGTFSGGTLTISVNGVVDVDFTPVSPDWIYPASGLPLGENTVVVTVTADDGTVVQGTTSVLVKPLSPPSE